MYEVLSCRKCGNVFPCKSPTVFDSFYCGWWERKADTYGA